MKMTFRWYGKDYDPIELSYIKQIPGMSGIMGVLDQYEAGQVWQKESIAALVNQCREVGLECKVIESVNVHEDIKLGHSSRDKYIANYCKTLTNLAHYGIKVVIYNFMPVFDWLRTDLNHLNPDGSTCLYYDEEQIKGMTPQDIVDQTAKDSGGLTLPGWEPERLAHLDEFMASYSTMTSDQLRNNYRYFLEGVVPTAEKVGIKLAVHPDDPAWPLFGIPRVCHSRDDLDAIVSMVDSPSNCLCLCSGSLGSNPDNDLPAIYQEFGKRGKVAAAHLRNVKYLGYRHFQEAQHLSADGDLDMYAIMKSIHKYCPDIYIRPDHGRMIWGESGRPGYPLYDRALGSVYLQGLWEAIDKQPKNASPINTTKNEPAIETIEEVGMQSTDDRTSDTSLSEEALS